MAANSSAVKIGSVCGCGLGDGPNIGSFLPWGIRVGPKRGSGSTFGTGFEPCWILALVRLPTLGLGAGLAWVVWTGLGSGTLVLPLTLVLVRVLVDLVSGTL